MGDDLACKFQNLQNQTSNVPPSVNTCLTFTYNDECLLYLKTLCLESLLGPKPTTDPNWSLYGYNINIDIIYIVGAYIDIIYREI